jgi:hypothetical protein
MNRTERRWRLALLCFALLFAFPQPSTTERPSLAAKRTSSCFGLAFCCLSELGARLDWLSRAVGEISGDQKGHFTRFPGTRKQAPKSRNLLNLFAAQKALTLTALAGWLHCRGSTLPSTTDRQQRGDSRRTPLCFHFRFGRAIPKKRAASLHSVRHSLCLARSLALPAVRPPASIHPPGSLPLFQHRNVSIQPPAPWAIPSVTLLCALFRLSHVQAKAAHSPLQAHRCTSANSVLDASDTRSSLLSTSTCHPAPIEAPIVSQTV